jgi:hypothetical protein
MFPRKSITKISIPTFAKSSEKVGVDISVIDFQGNILTSFKIYETNFSSIQDVTQLSTTFDFTVIIKAKNVTV